MLQQNLNYQKTWDAPFNRHTAQEITPVEFMKKINLRKVLEECQHVIDPVKCSCCGKSLPELCCRKCSAIFCADSCVSTNEGHSPSLNDDRVSGGGVKVISFSHEGKNEKETEVTSDSTSSSMEKQGTQNGRGSVPFNAQSETEVTSCSSSSSVASEPINAGHYINRRLAQGRGKPIKQLKQMTFIPHQVEARLLSEKSKVVTQEVVSSSSTVTLKAEQIRNHQADDCLVEEQNKCISSSEAVQHENGQSKINVVNSNDEEKKEHCPSFPSGSKEEEEVQVLDTFNVERINSSLKRFAEQQPLLEFNNDTFVIHHVYSFNRIHIMNPKINVDLLELIDDINDVCLEHPYIDGDIKIGDLVCAPFPAMKGDIMQRGIVVRVESNENFLIQFLEFGKVIRVPRNKLKPLTSELLKTPILGYKLKIRGVPDDLELVLRKDFEENLSHWLLELKITISDVRDIGDNLYEALVLSEEGNVANKILDLQKWDWEKLYEEGYRDDKSIRDHTLWRSMKGLDTSSIPILINVSQSPIKMKLSAFDPDSFELTFKEIQMSEWIREQNVLYRQIKRYVNMVSTSPYYPIISDSFLIQLDPEIGTTANWRRAIRKDSEEVYCIDTGSTYPLKNFEHAFRAICPEFLKVPAFAIKCHLSDFAETPKLKERIVQTFEPEKFYDVIILGFDTKSFCYNIRCNYDALKQSLS